MIKMSQKQMVAWVRKNCKFAQAMPAPVAAPKAGVPGSAPAPAAQGLNLDVLAQKVAKYLRGFGTTQVTTGDMLRALKMLGYDYAAIQKREKEMGTNFIETVNDYLGLDNARPVGVIDQSGSGRQV